MLITDIVDLEQVLRYEQQGLVTIKSHNEFPQLRIVNYTPKQGHRPPEEWSATMRLCRGLIWNNDTKELLARPFPKTFNLGQEYKWYEIQGVFFYEAATKLDGSLGIGYVRPDGKYAIATRGSFHSEQADWANAQQFVKPLFEGYTNLYEIIYPENKIVVDYGDMEGVMPLAQVENSTGEVRSAANVLQGGIETLDDLMRLKDPGNEEGYVVWVTPTSGFKYKWESYQKIHRFKYNTTPRKLWDMYWGDAEWPGEIPEECQEEFNAEMTRRRQWHNYLLDSIEMIKEVVAGYESRKDLAMLLESAKTGAVWRAMSFALYDNNQEKVINILKKISYEEFQ